MVQRSLEYEIRRQAALLAAGGTVVQETRLWNEERGETASMRSKESAQDYRYFPEPDLPPLHIPASLVDSIRAELPELPTARRSRWENDYGLPAHDVSVLLADHGLADYFEGVASNVDDPKAASNWVMTEVLRMLNETGGSIAEFGIAPDRLAGLLRCISAGEINRAAGKRAFAHMLERSVDVEAAIKALGLEQISDRAGIEPIVRAIMDQNPQPVADYKAGKTKALHALKGKVMKETKGKANPGMVDQILTELLSS